MKKVLNGIFLVLIIALVASCRKDAAANSSQNVPAKDSTFNGGNSGGGTGVTYTNVSLTGDQIKISLSKSDSGSITGVNFAAVTQNTYNCLNHFLKASLSLSGADYTLSFDGVQVPDAANCTAGQSTAACVVAASSVSIGAHNFSVKLNGVTYSGSFIKSATGGFTFSWPYSSGVTISPLVLN